MSVAMELAQQRKNELQKVLGSGRATMVKLVGGDETRAERLITSAMMAAADSPDVMDCDPRSILRSALQAAMIGADLAAGRGEGWLVPFGGKNGKVATFMDGYRLWSKKIAEAGFTLAADVVCVNDFFEYQRAPLVLKHKPDLFGERGEIKGAYAAAYRIGTDGAHILVAASVMPLKELDKARVGAKARNRGRESPAWKDWGERMYCRLPIKRVARELDLRESPGLQKLLEVAANHEDGNTIDADFDEVSEVDPKPAGDLDAGTHFGFGSVPDADWDKVEAQAQADRAAGGGGDAA